MFGLFDKVKKKKKRTPKKQIKKVSKSKKRTNRKAKSLKKEIASSTKQNKQKDNKVETKSTKEKYKYGKLPIRKYKLGGNHPHIIVEEKNNEILSVGLTNSSTSGHHKLKDVHESNGITAHMQHFVTEDKSKNYKSTTEPFNIDIESENRAKSMVNNYKDKKRNLQPDPFSDQQFKVSNKNIS